MDENFWIQEKSPELKNQQFPESKNQGSKEPIKHPT